LNLDFLCLGRKQQGIGAGVKLFRHWSFLISLARLGDYWDGRLDNTGVAKRLNGFPHIFFSWL
jgi:hypothetical protein